MQKDVNILIFNPVTVLKEEMKNSENKIKEIEGLLCLDGLSIKQKFKIEETISNNNLPYAVEFKKSSVYSSGKVILENTETKEQLIILTTNTRKEFAFSKLIKCLKEYIISLDKAIKWCEKNNDKLSRLRELYLQVQSSLKELESISIEVKQDYLNNMKDFKNNEILDISFFSTISLYSIEKELKNIRLDMSLSNYLSFDKHFTN